MTRHLYDLVSILTHYLRIDGNVVDVGSRVAPQQAHLNLRRVFVGTAKYVGIDEVEGPGVDVVSPFSSELSVVDSIGVVLCLDVLEHVAEPVELIHHLVRFRARYNAWLIVSTHLNMQYHPEPGVYGDYWRFSGAGLMRLLNLASAGLVQMLVRPSWEVQEDVCAIIFPDDVRSRVPDLDSRLGIAIDAAGKSSGWGPFSDLGTRT